MLKILTLSAVFPPKIIGGAELSAYNLAIWFSRQGHEVGVLTVADDTQEELNGVLINGLRIWRLRQDRHHTQHGHPHQSKTRKVIWHVRDHLDPKNASMVKKVVETFRPDVINAHVLQGLGHNAFADLDVPETPIFYFLHDLTLACIRTSMFRSGSNCARLCSMCAFSSCYKMSFLRGRKNVFLISPSASNLQTLDSHLNLTEFTSHVVPNIDLDAAIEHRPSPPGSDPKFIYIGQLSKIKGVEFILRVFDRLASEGKRFELNVVGGGPDERQLRSTFCNRPWLSFSGKVSSEQVRERLADSDALVLPSLWRENHPGVVRQALRAGIPAIVSNRGGSHEMVRHGISGMVVPAADDAAWHLTLRSLLDQEGLLERLQIGAASHGRSYSADQIGERYLEIMTTAKRRVSRP